MNTQLKSLQKLYPFRELKYIYSNQEKPEAVQIHIEDFLGLLETLQILSNKKLLRSIERGLQEMKTGKLLTHREVFG
jgi:PHD/YefM family antitoxin component YafN of YafNO toxin-antitoxin module